MRIEFDALLRRNHLTENQMIFTGYSQKGFTTCLIFGMSSATIKASVWGKLIAWLGVSSEEQLEEQEDRALIDASRNDEFRSLDSIVDEIKAERELRSSAKQTR